MDGAWARANRCKEFIEQVGRFPVDENEVEAFQGKSNEQTPYLGTNLHSAFGHAAAGDKENASPRNEWVSFGRQDRARRLSLSSGADVLEHTPDCFEATLYSAGAFSHRRRIGSPATELTKLTPSNSGRLSYPTAYFPCPPPHVSAPVAATQCYNSQLMLPAAPFPSPRPKLLEDLAAEQLQYLILFLTPSALASIEQTSKSMRSRVIDTTKAWRLTFFTALPHMYSLAQLMVSRAAQPSDVSTPPASSSWIDGMAEGWSSSLESASPVVTEDSPLSFPFQSASTILYKAFLAYECGTRTWLLSCELGSGRGCAQAERSGASEFLGSERGGFEHQGCREEEARCARLVKKCAESIEAMAKEVTDAEERKIIKWFLLRMEALV